MAKANIKAKPKTAGVKHKKTPREKKLKARNITNHTVQLHLPGGRYVRIGPSEMHVLTEMECCSRVLKKLERENVVHIAWPTKKEYIKSKTSTKISTTPSSGKGMDKEKPEKDVPGETMSEPESKTKTVKEAPYSKDKGLGASSKREQKNNPSVRENSSSEKSNRLETEEKKNESPGNLAD